MQKRYLSLVAISALMAFSPQALAAGGMTQVLPVSSEAEVMIEDSLKSGSGGGGLVENAILDYGYQNISLSVSLESQATPDSVYLSADYSISGVSSRDNAMDQLKTKFSEIKNTLKLYGEVQQTSLSVYESYGYGDSSTSSYTGYLNVRVDLKNVRELKEVQEILTSKGFNYWANLTLNEESKIELQLEMASQLRSLISKKKSVYETVIGAILTKVTSFYMDTYLDAYTYNPETNMATATTSIQI